MKTSIRWWSRLAFVASVGVSTLAACSSDKPDGAGDEKRTGTLALALQATAPSGNVYMLRNARFRIVNMRTGETVKTLKSDSGLPDASELTALLDSGSYTVTLLPDWFLERVGTSSGGSGGSFGTAGSPGKGGTSTFPEEPPIVGGAAGDPGEPGEPGIGGAPSGGGSGPIPGTAGTSVGMGGGTGSGEVVQAHLESDAVQAFFLSGGDQAFVHYQFQVGPDIVDFTKGTVIIGIGVGEDPSICVPPPGITMPERVLLESNTDAMSNVSLFSALQAIATNGDRDDDPIGLFQQIYDSFASAGLGQVPDAVHCGDEQTDGVPTLNGYPISCDRAELTLINALEQFQATAFVNRIDLAPLNGAHCGQQRMIFANRSFERALMIVEAQIPNPRPELGIDGCKPLAQFWLEQNSIPDGFERGKRLAQAFLFGDPVLAESGFGPFYQAENLTVGSGQIRTNTFVQDPWTLREFKLALDGERLRAVPFPVAESPHGALWNEDSGFPQGEACRDNFVASALEGLLTDDLEQMTFIVDGPCKDAESRNDFTQDYASQMSNGLRDRLNEALASTGLNADDIANRAQFAGSCIGCHMEAGGRFLGNGVFAPFQNDFPQVTEFPQQCTGGEQGFCFPPSQALQRDFLPTRLQVMSSLLGFTIIPNPCNNGGGGGPFPGTGGSFGMGTGGSFGTTGGTFASGGNFAAGGAPSMDPGGSDLPPIPDMPEPAPVVDIELPSSDEAIEVLEEVDAEIREAYGDVTLSGRSAKSTH